MSDHADAKRPDIVLVMTDQQRHDQIGYASDGHFETPTLDALAADGVIFEAAYSASTICVPARNALLTGLQPHRLPTQENEYALQEGFWTIAHELQRAGYETALFGKMHFAPVHAHHGFETMRLCEHLGWQGLGPISEARGDLYDDYHDWLLEQGLADYRVGAEGMPKDFPPEAHPTAWIQREVDEFLAERDTSRPLFLVVSFLHPHAPYDPPPPYDSMYDAADSVLPSVGHEANDKLAFVFALATSKSFTRAGADDTKGLRAFLASVRGMVRHIDDAVEDLVSRLDLERTLLFFTADHGDFSGRRGLTLKNPNIPFDDLALVPFFVVGAGVEGGRRVPTPVQSFDFALTCLDYAGVQPPSGVEPDARSLRPILEGAAAAEDLERTVFCATTLTFPMVRRGKFKYIRHVEHGQPVLFDLDADPDESVNLVDDPAYADVVADLEARLAEEMRQPVLHLSASA
jgi:arylsulfatase A-like enzyme